MRAFLALLLTASPVLAEAPKVITDIPPVAGLVAAVMGDLGQPVVLLDKGGDEHDLALKPSQMEAMTEADLVVWMGEDLTHELGHALEAVEVPKLTLLEAPETLKMDYPEGGVNPHAWLSPVNAKAWTGLIAARLSELDPENAATYAANAEAALAEIDALDAKLAAQLTGLKPFLTYHDAYGYLAAHYKLPYQGGLAAGEAHAPGAARLAEVEARVKSGEIACIFPEEAHDPALLEAFGTLGPALNPVGSDLDPTPQAWAILMQRLADGLATCR
ncbi:zinc ABC transporter substrate-binding protein [Stagnihabitans tardus]|uniref:High-affinity zinc uptake system protein ZnuA n=1 Tax=Stagnihabitans tardus TaxID=2699202 RepID=A0AAE5BVJ1_9RHOB|nr:zinc ABC transporter substrate-binding protein [Stagnihabitans tardus]NBZ87273.1 zinc ABC transporter solute-binding protein [Stagnihabitans tardus]